jgi:hypothetical protein
MRREQQYLLDIVEAADGIAAPVASGSRRS